MTIPTAHVYNYEAEMGLDSSGKAHVAWSRNDGGGGTAIIDLVPEAGYHVESITDNGVAQTLADP